MKCVAAAILAIAIAFGVSAMAQETGKAPAAPAKTAMEIERIVGKLTKIEGRSLTVSATVEGKTEEMTFTVGRGARFWKMRAETDVPPPAAGEKPREVPGRATFDDLKVGQEVRIFYHTNDNAAVSVLILAEAGGAKEK
jgi:hypothetical protein